MKLLLAIISVLFFLPVQAQNRFGSSAQGIDISAGNYVFELFHGASILLDEKGKKTIGDIIAENQMIPAGDSLVFFKPQTACWIRMKVKVHSAIQNWWLLVRDMEANNPYKAQNQNVDAWFVNEKGQVYRHQQSGTDVPRSKRAVPGSPGVNNVYFSASAGETVEIFIRIYNQNYPATISSIQLRDPSIPLPQVNLSTQLYVLNAIALVFTLISFFFFFFVKEKSYLYFGIYTLILSVHYLLNLHPDLPLITLFIPEHPYLTPALFNLLGASGFIFFFLFGRSFINLSALSPGTDRFLKLFLFSWGSLILIEAIVHFSTQRMLMNPYLLYVFAPFCLFILLRFVFFKTILARFFVCGAIWLICFTILGMLINNAVIDLPFNPWPVGQVGEMLIFAAGLAYKVRLNEKAKVEADRIKELDTIKSRFFANISHEFRTPLTLIQGSLQMIEDDHTSMKESTVSKEVPVRLVKTMRRNTDRLLELVNQLLDLSRLDSGKMDLKIIKGDVIQLVRALTASFDSMAERRQIHYHQHFPEQSHIAFFDKDKLEKIIVNLVGNAFKYTPEKGTVAVNLEIDENRMRVMIEDSGPGISKKELDKIFDRFYRVEGTEEKGTGLGLALVKELVELYRGQISVSSEPGKGSSFRISLPISREQFHENELVYGEWTSDPPSTFQTSGEEYEKSHAENLNALLPLVLIVEDNNELRNFISDIIRDQYQVIEAADGSQGLETALAEVPDLIISDVMMPGMDGFELVTRLKKDERTSHIPVILLTAKAGLQHRIEGLETGADDYLTKPFDSKELLVRVQNLLHQRKLLRKKFAGEIILKPSEIAATSADENFLTRILHEIEANMSEDDFGVEQLARAVAMSRSQLHRKLVALTGQSPSEVLRNTRLLRAKEMLQKKVATPSEVAFKVGFNSHTYFSKCFKEEFGITPGEMAKGG